MFLIDRLILLAAVLLLAGIVSSKFSARMGLPVLVLFLGIGMLAGEDGIGGIEFDNVDIAHAIGTLSSRSFFSTEGFRRARPRSARSGNRRCCSRRSV
jgi:NhaP-type Na+/H+ and K+/H+ antiporter